MDFDREVVMILLQGNIFRDWVIVFLSGIANILVGATKFLLLIFNLILQYGQIQILDLVYVGQYGSVSFLNTLNR